MFRNCFIHLFGAVLAIVLIVFPAIASADSLSRAKVVGDMTVYLGLMPVEALRHDPKGNPAHNLTSLPTGANVYHVMLALFDTATGARITDASVAARVAPLGLSGASKTLVPFAEAGAVAYSNYFRISSEDIYRIKADIRRHGSPTPYRAEFMVRPHRSSAGAR